MLINISEKLVSRAIIYINIENVGPLYEHILNYVVKEGVYNEYLRQKLFEGRFGHNGNNDCDSFDSRCSCGSYHSLKDKVKILDKINLNMQNNSN